MKIKAVASIFLAVVGFTACSDGGQSIATKAQQQFLEQVGEVAMEKMRAGGHRGFREIPIETLKLAPGVWQVQGIANTHAIQTESGFVLFDTGLVIQAAHQRKLLHPKLEGPLTHIILSHSHADHVGGYRVWKEGDTLTIAHREFEEAQRYLTELNEYLHQRNRIMFNWMPEKPATLRGIMNYRGIEPDILVDQNDYHFTEGGVEFQVLSTPGAEGADNLTLWLPQQKILFTGDTLGPNFPQFPNIFSARGEKIRKPIEYIASLNKLIALKPEMLVPGHGNPVRGKNYIVDGLTRIRDATQYVHDQVIAGMNDGRSVYELMETISLPAHLKLSQEHGKVSWAVKSIWEYYATWFHFDTPTELYHVPVREVYSDVVGLAGADALINRAEQHLASGDDLKALHLAEMVVYSQPANRNALLVYRKALEVRRRHAENVTKNTFEYDVINMYINRVNAQLDKQQRDDL